MEFKSINPYNNKEVGSYTALSKEETTLKLNSAQNAFKTWSRLPLSKRASLIQKAGQVLRDNVEEYAKMITMEMGKPISESKAEVNKCAWVCDYYAENAAAFLADETIATDTQQSFVRHDPLG
ncbi:MAG: aldehyde dehydrogenase family protein, partial [Maribacter sp.]